MTTKKQATQCCGRVTDWGRQIGSNRCERKTRHPSGFCHTCREHGDRYQNPWTKEWATPDGWVKNSEYEVQR